MRCEVTINYSELSEQRLEMLIEILEELGLDIQADEVRDFLQDADIDID